MIPGTPKNPAMQAVTKLMGKKIPVNPDMRFKSHKLAKPARELIAIFQTHFTWAAQSRKKPKASAAGIKILRKFSMMTSVYHL